MRGKPVVAEWFALEDGITPAHAGKTASLGRSAPAVRDHPRACGENMSLTCSSVSLAGSPPRMRGKLTAEDLHLGDDGITPAHAGKTPRHRPARRQRRDHPRACGENTTRKAVRGKCPGSPPRMRGKRAFPYDSSVMDGITPAHAGKTAKKAGRKAERRDHPRACGENRASKKRSGGGRGSPPRMRGKLCRPS